MVGKRYSRDGISYKTSYLWDPSQWDEMYFDNISMPKWVELFIYLAYRQGRGGWLLPGPLAVLRWKRLFFDDFPSIYCTVLNKVLHHFCTTIMWGASLGCFRWQLACYLIVGQGEVGGNQFIAKVWLRLTCAFAIHLIFCWQRTWCQLPILPHDFNGVFNRAIYPMNSVSYYVSPLLWCIDWLTWR